MAMAMAMGMAMAGHTYSGFGSHCAALIDDARYYLGRIKPFCWPRTEYLYAYATAAIRKRASVRRWIINSFCSYEWPCAEPRMLVLPVPYPWQNLGPKSLF
jgi:hypothetical protein